MSLALFTSNYPHSQPGRVSLLPTPERLGALPAYTGRGVVMAFVDSGFYPHPDLLGRILVHVDASTNHVVEQRGDDFYASDLSWHGQMTSVIAAGDGKLSGGKFRGIASEAQLVLIKVSSPRGHIKERDIMRGLRWLMDTHRRFNVKVLNLSVGGDFESFDPKHPIYRALRKLTESGVTVVAAAGNRGLQMLVPPASSPHAITVGGINDHNSLDRKLWTQYQSNYGYAYDRTPKPDITAPAIWIASPILPGSMVDREANWLGALLKVSDQDGLRRLLEKGYAELGLSRQQAQQPDDKLFSMLQSRIHTHKIVDTHYQHVDGTSVAAPIVSSVIAQMLQANPRLTPAQIRAILTTTAKQLPDVPPERQGAGVIDAAKAVLAAASYSISTGDNQL